MIVAEKMKKAVRFLASTELAIALFLVISVVAIPGTVSNNRAIYSSPLFIALLALFGLNLILCTQRRFSSISWPVLVLHSGVLVTLLGCIVASFGYVATVNVYEGTRVDQVYRWDLKADAPLGAVMELKKINFEFHPMPIRIGVLKGEAKEGLFELKTGQSFQVGGYRVEVGQVEFNSENLRLTVFQGDRPVGTFDTLPGTGTLPKEFPYSFKLVAFKTPRMKRLWVDLQLTDSSGATVSGSSEVNGPFQWNGLYFFNTQVDRDSKGVPYAGIQIVRDPGRWLVFVGMSIVALGAVLATVRRWYGAR